MSKNSPDLQQTPKRKVIWFTGLSGSGKTTLAYSLQQKLTNNGFDSIVLDGDELRKGINSDLGFTTQDRYENIRRAAEIAKLLIKNNQIVICSFITPTEDLRFLAKSIVNEDNYSEVFLDCSLTICEKRDVKSLYEKARKGEIKNFTGLTSVFEKPNNPSIILNTEYNSIENCVNELYYYIINSIKPSNLNP